MFLRNNGLSIALLTLFLIFLGGQFATGHRQYNEERADHRQEELTSSEYLKSDHFLEATMENWESEFLQMFAYVLLTAFLFQKGSSESKDPDEEEEVDRDPRQAKNKKDAPWPVRKGGWILTVYENSLALAFLLLFIASMLLHALGGAREYSEDQVLHGGQPISFGEYLKTSRFWFESFQNWQSEFLAIACMVIFSIWLRQRHSPESKPVDAPHAQTGTS